MLQRFASIHLREQLKELQRQLGVTTIMVTHDQEEAMAVADRIVVMNNGVIEQEVFTKPVSPFAAGLLGDMNFIPADLQINQSDNGQFSAMMKFGDGALSTNICLSPEGLEKLGVQTDSEKITAVDLCIRPADIVLTKSYGVSLSSNTTIKAIIKIVSFMTGITKRSISK